jgi:hypothetical protein
MTFHKCQGLTIDPVKKGSPPNAAGKRIVDIGSRNFESLCPGLFYVALSRVTATGQGDRMKSAIYFTNDNLTKHQIVNMTLTDKGRNNVRVAQRDIWVQLLHLTEEHTQVKPYQKAMTMLICIGNACTIQIDHNFAAK